MNNKNKKKSFVLCGLLNALCVLLVLCALLVNLNTAIASISGNKPSVFGYTAVMIEDSSMSTVFKTGEYVAFKNVSKPADIAEGDIISFYAYRPWIKPALKDDDRKDKDCVTVFHRVQEIIVQDGVTYFKTKGDTNAQEDNFLIPFESVSGKYVKTNAAVVFVIKLCLQDFAVIYWSLLCIAVILIYWICALFNMYLNKRLQKKVIDGDISLLNKKCFTRNIFNGFSGKSKQEIIDGAPFGFKPIYEDLLRGTLTERGDAELYAKIKDKRCNSADVHSLTYAAEVDSALNANEYINALPQKPAGEKPVKAEFGDQLRRRKVYALSSLIGALLFTALYLVLSLMSSAVMLVSIIERIIVAAVLIVFFVTFALTGTRYKNAEKRRNDYLAATQSLPERYRFLLVPELYSSNQIDQNALTIEELLRGKKDMPVTEPVYEPTPEPIPEPIPEPQFQTEEEPKEEYKADDSEEEPQNEEVEEIEDIEEIEEVQEIEEIEETEETEETEQADEDKETDKPNEATGPYALLGLNKRKGTISFLTRLKMTPPECHRYYESIKNALLSRRKVKSRLSGKCETFRTGRLPLVKMIARGKALRVYFALQPDSLEERYHIKDVGAKRGFAEFPALLTVRSDRSFKYAMEIVELLGEAYELKINPKYVAQDFAGGLSYVNPFETEGATDADKDQFIIAEFPTAVKKGEIKAEYLPEYSISGRKLAAATVKMSWQHPVFENIDFGKASDSLNRLECDKDLMELAVNAACKTIGGQGNAGVRIGIDAKPEMLNAEFIDKLLAAATNYNAPIDRIYIILPTKAIMAADDQLKPLLKQLKQSGVGISASECSLMTEIDKVKSVCSDIRINIEALSAAGKDINAVVTKLSERAKSHGLNVIAENVNSRPQVKELDGSGATGFCGKFFSPAISEEKLMELLSKNKI